MQHLQQHMGRRGERQQWLSHPRSCPPCMRVQGKAAGKSALQPLAARAPVRRLLPWGVGASQQGLRCLTSLPLFCPPLGG